MLRQILITAAFLLSPLLTSAHVPYLDDYNVHNSYASAFPFPDSAYSRALCTTTICPPRFFRGNSTSSRQTGGRRKIWSPESWSKVYLQAGEDLHFEFGVPHVPALEYPAFRPTVYLLGKCLPSPEVFGHPKPQEIEYPPFDLPPNCDFKALRFHLADPIWEPTKFHERHLDATFLSYLNYKVPIGCNGHVYIVVETYEKRVVEFYVAVGKKDEFPPYESTDGIARIEDTRAWANGDNTQVGKYCKKRGIWEKE